MYLKTPKRYSGKRNRPRLISLRWWWLYLLTAIVVVVGAFIWDQRDAIRPIVENAIAERIEDTANDLATRQAPTATATDSPYNYLALANDAYGRGAMDEAIANYRLAAEGMPNDVDVHFLLAHLLTTNNQVEEGVEAAEKAINADPFNPLAWAIKGMALDWSGEYEAAIAALYQAIALDPENATAYAFLAEAYVDYGALERAIDAAETAITLDETDYNVQRNYGYVAQYALGDFDTAIQSYERAQQLAPTRGYIALDLVAMYRRDGRSDQAVTMLESIIERNPENGTAYAELARVLLADLGEREKARDAAERCIAVAPNNISCLSFLGSLQLVAGEYNLCARTLDRAIQAGSSNALDYQYAGTCYIVIDDCVRAREILLEGMDLARTVETQTNIRDALAQCQTIVTLAPSATPEGFDSGADLTATPGAGE
jgi:tetratricopeptide (TPR) repeat protein